MRGKTALYKVDPRFRLGCNYPYGTWLYSLPLKLRDWSGSRVEWLAFSAVALRQPCAQGQRGHTSRVGSKNRHRNLRVDGSSPSVERLVCAEADNRQAKGINCGLLVQHLWVENVGDSRRPTLPLDD